MSDRRSARGPTPVDVLAAAIALQDHAKQVLEQIPGVSLTPLHSSMLIEVSRYPGANVAARARRLGKLHGNVSYVIKELVKQGLVENADPNKMSARHRLTEEGERILGEAQKALSPLVGTKEFNLLKGLANG